MSKSYENLPGAVGKARFFRPSRYEAAEIFSGRPPRLVFEDEIFDLDNISARGAGCISRRRRDDNPYAAPGAKGVLRLTQSGRELFLGAARKARHTAGPGGVSAGFELEENSFDLDWLIRENASILARSENTAVADNPEPSAAYKTFCAEAAAFIGGYLQRIQKYVAPIEGRLGEDERNDIARDLANAAEAEWLDLLREGAALVNEIHADKQKRIGYKSFTERTVTQMLLAGPGWARCLFKPAGYPGDYKIMNYGYEQKPEGAAVNEKFLHLLGMIASRAIITRMEMVASLITEYATSHKHSGTDEFSITSVGCGPARELEDILEGTPRSVSWKVTLVDQEPAALDYAFDRVANFTERDRMQVTGLNISFREMLRPTPDNAAFVNNDIIYSSGFVDYLNPLLAQRFVKRLYDFVKPGGRVIVGNVNNQPTGMMWPLEYITDWSLYFRNEDEMRAMASEIPDAKVSVIPDPMEAIYFLVVEKPE